MTFKILKSISAPQPWRKIMISKVDYQLSMHISHKTSKRFFSTLIAHFIAKRHFQNRLCFYKHRLVSCRAPSALRQSRTKEADSLQRILIRLVYKHHCTPISGSLETKHATGSFTFFNISGGNGGG